MLSPRTMVTVNGDLEYSGQKLKVGAQKDITTLKGIYSVYLVIIFVSLLLAL